MRCGGAALDRSRLDPDEKAITTLPARLLLLGLGRAACLSGGARATAAFGTTSSPNMWRVTTTTDADDAEKKLLASVSTLGGRDVEQERIVSYYWWEGKVQNDEERRLSFTVEKPFAEVLDVVGKVTCLCLNSLHQSLSRLRRRVRSRRRIIMMYR